MVGEHTGAGEAQAADGAQMNVPLPIFLSAESVQTLKQGEQNWKVNMFPETFVFPADLMLFVQTIFIKCFCSADFKMQIQIIDPGSRLFLL